MAMCHAQMAHARLWFRFIMIGDPGSLGLVSRPQCHRSSSALRHSTASHGGDFFHLPCDHWFMAETAPSKTNCPGSHDQRIKRARVASEMGKCWNMTLQIVLIQSSSSWVQLVTTFGSANVTGWCFGTKEFWVTFQKELGISSSQLTNIIFQRARAKNHQPVF